MTECSSENSPSKRILLCRTDRLGDVILALPCALLVRRLLPESRVSFLVHKYTAPVVRMFEGLDEVLEFDDKIPVRSLAQILKRERFDAAVALYPDFRLARVLRIARIELRAGIAYRWYSPLFSYRHREHRKLNLKHELEYNLSLTFATFCGQGRWENHLSPESIFPLDLRIPEEAVERASTILKEAGNQTERIVALHPGGGGSAHRWPLESFCELARKLAQDSNATLVVTGGAGETHLCDEVTRASAEKALNLCGKLTLPELAAVYRNCSLLVTNSTGPLHLGRAVGTTVLGLFPSDRSMSPVRWGPYGLPESALTPPEGGTMSDLSVMMVLERALHLLEGLP